MPDPRYFGIALTLDELHKGLGLPSDTKIYWAEMGLHPSTKEAVLLVNLAGPADQYDGTERMNQSSFFRPDIQTREVSQVVIHQLKEK